MVHKMQWWISKLMKSPKFNYIMLFHSILLTLLCKTVIVRNDNVEETGKVGDVTFNGILQCQKCEEFTNSIQRQGAGHLFNGLDPLTVLVYGNEMDRVLTGKGVKLNKTLGKSLLLHGQYTFGQLESILRRARNIVGEQIQTPTDAEFNSTKSGMGEVIYAINAGGEAHTDVHGVRYQKDPLKGKGGTGSEFSKRNEVGRVPQADQLLYQTGHYAFATFAYDVPVPDDAHYVLVLKFCEFDIDASNENVFDVRLNGALTVISELDIYDKVGRDVAHDEYVPFEISKGKLIVRNSKVKFNGVLRVEFAEGPEGIPIVNAFYVMKGNVDQVPKLPPLKL